MDKTSGKFEKIISFGVDINAMTHLKTSAISRAISFQNYDGVRALLELGFNMESYSGGVALRDAAWKGELEMVRLFVEHEVDVNFKGAVQMAANGNHFEIVKYLVEQGADVTLKDKYTGFIIWIPDQKCLGSFDVEHEELFTFEGMKWNKFIKKIPTIVNHVLNGLPIDELYK